MRTETRKLDVHVIESEHGAHIATIGRGAYLHGRTADEVLTANDGETADQIYARALRRRDECNRE